MNPLRFNSTLLALLLSLGLFSGCTRKRPVLVMPQEQPPSAARQPAPPSSEPQKTADSQTQTEQQTPPATEPQTQAGQQTPDQNKAKRTRRHTAARKPAAPPSTGSEKPAEVARNTPPRKIVKEDKVEPPPSSGQISPAPTPTNAGHDPSTTEQLLQSTESQMNGLKRPLTKDEEATLAQIREFIAQSRKATTENDLVRAHNLAQKAHLLSDSLIKPR